MYCLYFSLISGCIDDDVVIDPPEGGKDEYIDRKGNVSLCVQGVCDENRKFINFCLWIPRVMSRQLCFKKFPTI